MNFMELSRHTGMFLEASVNISTATDTSVIAAKPGYTTRVYKMVLGAGGTVTINIKSGSTSLSGGAIAFAVNTGLVLPLDQTPWFTCATDEAFVFTSVGTGQLSGRVYYTQTRTLS